jgi:hypothetical protein
MNATLLDLAAPLKSRWLRRSFNLYHWANVRADFLVDVDRNIGPNFKRDGDCVGHWGVQLACVLPATDKDLKAVSVKNRDCVRALEYAVLHGPTPGGRGIQPAPFRGNGVARHVNPELRAAINRTS